MKRKHAFDSTSPAPSPASATDAPSGLSGTPPNSVPCRAAQWGKGLLLWLLVWASLAILGEIILRWAIRLAYAGAFPIGIVNRILTGQNVHPVDHYLSYFGRLWRIGVLCLGEMAAFAAITGRAARRQGMPTCLLSWLEGGLVVVVAGCIFLLGLFRDVGLYDEGVILTGAWQVSQGAIPYRDFSNIYGPGQVALLGGLFAVLGKSLLLARLYDWAIRCGITLVIWGLLRPFLSPVRRLAAHLSIVCWLHRSAMPLYPVYPALLCQLGAIWLLLRPSDARRARLRHFCSGLLVGGGILFRHDLGALFAVLLVAGSWMLARQHGQDAQKRNILPLALGTMLPPVLAYGGLLWWVPFPVLWHQLVSLPLFAFPAYRALPYPSLFALFHTPRESLPFYLFPLLMAIGLLGGTVRTMRARFPSAREQTVFLLAILSLAGLPQALGRSDSAHLIPLSIPAIALFFLLLPASRRMLPAVFLFLMWSGSGPAKTILLRTLHPLKADNLWPATVPPSLATVMKTCPPGPIFIGNQTHDSLVVNHPALYFLLDRNPGTRFFYFEPAEIMTSAVQSEIIAELLAHHVETVVLWDEPPHHEPNRSSEDSQARVLDSWIRAHYRLETSLPPYSVWRWRASP